MTQAEAIIELEKDPLRRLELKVESIQLELLKIKADFKRLAGYTYNAIAEMEE